MPALVLVVVAGVAVSGCSAGPAAAPSPPATYRLPGRTVRVGEVALDGRPVALGPLRASPIGWTPYRASVVGTHAELLPRQPLQVSLGAHDRLELDVWWDVPAGARPDAVVLVGEHGSPTVRVPLPPG